MSLANAAKAFEPSGAPQLPGRLEHEHARLKNLVGELALELKKARRCSGAQPWPLRLVTAAALPPTHHLRVDLDQPACGLPNPCFIPGYSCPSEESPNCAPASLPISL